MGAKIKTQKQSLGLPTKPKKIPGPKIIPSKNPMANFQASKSCKTSLGILYLQNYVARGYVGTTTNLQTVFNTPKNPYLNQATPKDTLQISLTTKILESKISNPKISFNHPLHLKSGVPPIPLPGLLVTMTSPNALPLSDRRLMGAKATN